MKRHTERRMGMKIEPAAQHTAASEPATGRPAVAPEAGGKADQESPARELLMRLHLEQTIQSAIPEGKWSHGQTLRFILLTCALFWGAVIFGILRMI